MQCSFKRLLPKIGNANVIEWLQTALQLCLALYGMLQYYDHMPLQDAEQMLVTLIQMKVSSAPLLHLTPK